jgi:hypothetical protein
MEVKATSGIKVIEGSKIKSFIWLDSLKISPEYFVNAKDYTTEENVPLTGFFQILADGKLPLFKHTKAVLVKANYSLQFDVGKRDDTIVQKEKLYYASNGRVFELPTKQRKILPLFGDKSAQVHRFIKVNMLHVKDEMHVQKVFEFYNSLN